MSKLREQRELEIGRIAENLAHSHFPNGGCIDPFAIAVNEGIPVSFEEFQGQFLGLTSYFGGDIPFHVYLNQPKPPNNHEPRLRSTLGHELGHIFIPEHRKKLESGISLSWDGAKNYSANRAIENEAQAFAAHLLMPKSGFIEYCNDNGCGMTSILLASAHYKTSITSASYHYSKCDVLPCINIKWDNDNRIDKKWISKGFQKIIPRCLMFQFNQDRPLSDVENCSIPGTDFSYSRSLTNLSSWIFNWKKFTSDDLILIEETFNLGAFGGVTLLRLENPTRSPSIKLYLPS